MTNYNKLILYTPIPSNISYIWNIGSILGLCLIIQIITGFFLTIFYENTNIYAFDSINQINRNINIGWLIRSLHANGASIFFIFIYLHIGRGLYFKSFYNYYAWYRGTLLLFLLFITAFLGYVLPWGQIRYWGATVITNLLSSIPYIGNSLTYWIWGGFSVRKSTLIRFFRLHFILPLIIILFVFIHIILLHSSGSSNPLGVPSKIDIIPFHSFFTWKDLTGYLLTIIPFLFICFLYPFIQIDPDNFIPANPIITPPHIQPEWYFLFAYSILRTIPRKLGGVSTIIFSILSLLFLPIYQKHKSRLIKIKIFNKIIISIWFMNFIYLRILGAIPIEQPYIYISEISTKIYFFFLFII